MVEKAAAYLDTQPELKNRREELVQKIRAKLAPPQKAWSQKVQSSPSGEALAISL